MIMQMIKDILIKIIPGKGYEARALTMRGKIAMSANPVTLGIADLDFLLDKIRDCGLTFRYSR